MQREITGDDGKDIIPGRERGGKGSGAKDDVVEETETRGIG